MRRIISLSSLVLAFSLTTVVSTIAQPMDLEAEYLDAIASYYEVERSAVEELVGDDLKAVEVAVIYGLAVRSGKDASQVASIYRANNSWSATSAKLELKAVDFYIMVSGKINSKSFSPIFAKFHGLEPHLWKNITLTDTEITDMVNLRLLSSHHDYSLFDIMAMRDYGSGWERINQKVGLAKKALLEKLAKDTLQ